MQQIYRRTPMQLFTIPFYNTFEHLLHFIETTLPHGGFPAAYFQNTFLQNLVWGYCYMIPVCRDEISIRSAGTNFTIRVYAEIKYHPGKTEQFFTWYLFRFVYIFF